MFGRLYWLGDSQCICCLVGCVKLHALANATKRLIWWKRLDNIFIFQHSPSRVASLGLNIDRKWAAISLFNIASAGSWTQDLLALIPCKTACSSQCDQKTDLMEETRQYIYTSTGCMGWEMLRRSKIYIKTLKCKHVTQLGPCIQNKQQSSPCLIK
jgi:hypothetical protein